MEKPTKYWLEAGTVLCFEKQPDKPFIPRRGESFTSQAVYKADDVDVILAQRDTIHAELARVRRESEALRVALNRADTELARVREALRVVKDRLIGHGGVVAAIDEANIQPSRGEQG